MHEGSYFTYIVARRSHTLSVRRFEPFDRRSRAAIFHLPLFNKLDT